MLKALSEQDMEERQKKRKALAKAYKEGCDWGDEATTKKKKKNDEAEAWNDQSKDTAGVKKKKKKDAEEDWWDESWNEDASTKPKTKKRRRQTRGTRVGWKMQRSRQKRSA